MVYDNVNNHNTPFYPQYVYTQQGSFAWGPWSFAYYGFRFDVKDATGSAAFLNGGSYIGICVNTMFPDPQNNDTATYSDTPALLTYDLGSGDYWATNRALKFAAIKDVLATYATQLRNLSPDGADYANIVSGIGLSVTEIVVDYDGTLGSINLNAGNSTAWLDMFGTPITSGAAFDVYTNIRDNVIGSGVGNSFEVYTANVSSSSYQDLAFISVVPEPSTYILFLGGAVALYAFRRGRLSA